MIDPRFERVKALFAAVVDLDGPGRNELLARQCADDPGLRGEVESLLSVGRLGALKTGGAHGAIGTALGNVVGHKSGDWIGPYLLLEPLGEGTFGEVWLAEQGNPVRAKVAVKIVKAGMD